jgi:hypothetical protein
MAAVAAGQEEGQLAIPEMEELLPSGRAIQAVVILASFQVDMGKAAAAVAVPDPRGLRVAQGPVRLEALGFRWISQAPMFLMRLAATEEVEEPGQL